MIYSCQEMFSTSYHPDQWDLMRRGADPATGQPSCLVRHTTHADGAYTTVHRLVLYSNGWRHVGRWVGSLEGEGYIRDPEPHGKKLSNSVLDLAMQSLAEHGHPMAYA